MRAGVTWVAETARKSAAIGGAWSFFRGSRVSGWATRPKENSVGLRLSTVSALLILFTIPLLFGQAQHAKVMSVPDLDAFSRGVTVQVNVRSSQGAGRGSGVWSRDDSLVATCYHVVAHADHITVSWGGFVGAVGSLALDGIFRDTDAAVVAKNEAQDVAILRVKVNPLKVPPAGLVKTPTQLVTAKISVAGINTQDLALGQTAVVSGYPLQGNEFIVQNGAVAGIGFPRSATSPTTPNNLANPTDRVRIFLSLVSNPGNSGGPVLNDKGQLIGLLEGNLTSPIRDSTRPDQTQLYGLRPNVDSAGNLVNGANGQPSYDVVPLSQNSGISIVVPARFVKKLLDTVETEPTR